MAWPSCPLVVLALCGLLVTSASSNPSQIPFPTDVAGRALVSVLDQLRDEGLEVLYSTAIVSSDLIVVAQPGSSDTLEALDEVLAPMGLRLFPVDDVYVVGRHRANANDLEAGRLRVIARDVGSKRLLPDVTVTGLPDSVTFDAANRGYRVLAGHYTLTVSSPGFQPAVADVHVVTGAPSTVSVTLTPIAPVLAEIVVSASRFDLAREKAQSATTIDHQAIVQFPDLGNDPLRAIQRLPSAASSGASGRTHVRGAAKNETGVVLDGHRLLDPFHVRDYQSLFSAIDTRIVDDMEVYSGGYPARYGDLTGGLVVVNSIVPDRPTQREIGLSVFSTSLFAAGQFENSDSSWLFSARRGNLDIILDPSLGEPSYYDVFAKLDTQWSDTTRISATALLADDAVLVIPASDVDEREESNNNTRNLQLWASWDQAWSPALMSKTTVSFSDIKSLRVASVADEEKIIGALSDRRISQMARINQDWEFANAADARWQWGWQFSKFRSNYDYVSNVQYAGSYLQFPQLPPSGTRMVDRSLRGEQLAAYGSARWQLSPSWVADVGVRWEKQSYIDHEAGGQWSPRISLLYELNDSTDVRLHWGRYFQVEAINELQVTDGITDFFAPQRADNAVLALTHRVGEQLRLRAEAYRKSDRSLRPRFENLFDRFSVIPEIDSDRIIIRPTDGFARGVELSFDYDANENSTWWGSYTLSEANDTIDGRRQPRSWDQRHSVNLGYGWTGKRWSFNIAAKAHSGWPRTDVFLAANTANDAALMFGERNADRFGHWMSVDFRVDYRQSLRRGSLNWFFEVTNATNRRNSCCVDFDVEESDSGTLVLDEHDEYWFPLLPAFGVLWEFE